nr:esterase FE4 [Halyomorpha halys]XP_024218967.1 esterase FE4 [Halyomorpha halys]
MGTLQKVTFLLFLAGSLAENPLIVDTSTGKVRGYKMTSRSGRKFLAFSGVPYAKPPVGPLRFQPPEEVERWIGVRDATEPGPYCLQYGTFEEKPEPFGSEDCLYLSVYTHSTRGRAAVLVHIHAGGFHMGNGQRWYLPNYLMDEDVVIVDVNYRLAYLGFLSFEDKEMPGNQGLKDQVMALRWVKKNIAKFGGDPNKVTLVGESAGGASVYHHTVSPLSRGLFHKGIAESGTSYNPWALSPPGFAKSMAQQLAKNLGCPISSTSAAVSCLRSKKGSDIVSRIVDLIRWQVDMEMNWAVLEPEGYGAFLTGPVSKWQHQPVPMIIGQTAGEGLLRTHYIVQNNTDFNWLNDNFDRLAPVSLWYSASASNPDEVTRKVRRYYFPDGQIRPEFWVNLTQMYTDSWITIGAIDGANLHTGPVYFYYFDYVGEYTFDEGVNRTLYFAAPHIEESEFLWQRPWTNRTFKGEDLALSKKLVKVWTDFAKYGNPTPRGSGFTWNKWKVSKHNYLHISHSGWEQKEGFATDRYNFWKSLNYRDKFN